MKSAICEEPRKIVIKNVEEPKYKQDEVLIKVKSAGISRLDFLTYMGKYPKAKYPIVLGHELSGEIVAVGKKVINLEIGDEVVIEPLLSCEKCDPCLSGKHSLCQDASILGFDANGAFSEYVAVKSSFAHIKSETISLDEATLITSLASSIHAVKQAEISIGDQVVILGAGYTGLITLQVVRLSGASAIIMDEDSERLHFAADLGADYVLSPSSSDAEELIMALSKNDGIGFLFDCMGDPEYYGKAINMLCKNGKIVVMEYTGNNLDQLPLADILANEITLIGSTIHCNNFQTAIELVNSGSVNLNSIISNKYEFNEISEAFEELSGEPKDIIKAIIKFEAEED